MNKNSYIMNYSTTYWYVTYMNDLVHNPGKVWHHPHPLTMKHSKASLSGITQWHSLCLCHSKIGKRKFDQDHHHRRLLFWKRHFLPSWARVGHLAQVRQPNSWWHFTRFNSTNSGKIAISQLSTHGYWSKFLVPFHTNQFGLGKRHWDLETSIAVVEFLPLYHFCLRTIK